ncbi:HNH endonuclease [Blastococcus sp. CT_GayMR19]|uniref:HNH endonuclease signature motif containing protein n=1 Tax=Blastococcus sp. CT_GayMR19 TaxID=2559608 RepID=UPI001073535A|nr:HNH endonuclease signature motif containing protein [Blastococcus sp. CT_GayMR19]TFV76892.1 HNH endonuclease [Blastococcus sp. CT_GayMR19]
MGGRSWSEDPVPEGVVARPSRLSEVLPVADRSDAEIALELGRIVAVEAALVAYKSELVMGLAGHRPDALDPAPGQPGAGGNADGPIPGTSEFFVDELALVLNGTARAAGTLARDAYVLTERLPVVWAALADGQLDWPRARVFIDVLSTTAEGVAEAVSPTVLPDAVGLSLGKLRARLTREVLAVDADAADKRRRDAERAADVRVYPTYDGMSELLSEMPSPVAAACWSTIDELAWMRKHDGDPRPIGQLRALTHAELILRPWDTSRLAVTAVLDVSVPLPSLTAAGSGVGAEPGEVNGQPVTAAHVRELLEQLDSVCTGGLQAPTGGSLQISVTDADGVLLATTSRAELARIARGGCDEHPGNGSIADCGCAVLERPPPVDRYTPTPAQRRFAKTRDRTCRHPGCGQPVARVDLDHVVPYPEGATDCDNLCCLCRRHHRLKTFAPGWRFSLTPDGRLQVTTPSGVTRTTRPPGLRNRIEQRALPAAPPPPEEPPPF